MGARRRGRHATALLVATLLVGGGLVGGVWTPAAPAAGATPPDPLAQLQDDADGALRVSRDETGRVVAVDSADGGAVLSTTASTPAAAAREVMAAHGDVVGLDPATARVEQVVPVAAGGSVVRAQQVVDGLPVLGGVVVTVLDDQDDLVSLGGATSPAATSPATTVPGATPVGLADASATARRAVAAAHDLDPGALRVRSLGRWLYDPALLGVDDAAGPRPVWRLEVGAAGVTSRVSETVLVGSAGGEVALRFSATPGAGGTGTVVCDRRQVRSDAVDPCGAAPRPPGAAPTGVADVDAAHEHLAEAVATYADLGVDLPALLGGPATATVRWCDAASCRAEAFWDQQLQQGFFGPGMPQADDVVAHELTHGWVRATAGLFYLQQSGAVDETIADVVGELVDHRHGSDDDSAWRMGEDAPGFTSRSMADPAAEGRPDRMTSPLWVDEDALAGQDLGGVHTNLGVGDKTAYLISQGGTFNGRTVRGLDEGDATLTRSATLWLQSVPQLTPGADFADLGRVLEATCARLAADGVAGFTATDCLDVREAVAATELGRPPVVGRQPVTAPMTCAAGTSAVTLRRDDDAELVQRDTPAAESFGLVDGPGAVTMAGEYATSGRLSRSLLDRVPGEAAASWRSTPFRVPTSAGGSFVRFHHATSFQLAADGSPLTGGRLVVERQQGTLWRTVTGLPWRNGPTDRVPGVAEPVFGGDSRGWAASTVDLTSLGGAQVRLTWVVDAPRTAGPQAGRTYGWWLDDVRLYACATPVTAAPGGARAVLSGSTATVTWDAPTRQLTEVQGYRVTRSDSTDVVDVPAGSLRTVLSGLAGPRDVDVRVAAVGVDGRAGPVTTARLEATTVTTAAPARVRRGARFTLTARLVEAGTSTPARAVTATLERLPAGARTWSTAARSTTNNAGTLRWTLSQRATTAYRVVTAGSGRHLATTSAPRTVRLR